MPYKLSILPCWDGESSILELDYTGKVSFRERTRALDDMSAMLTTTTMQRILVDFSKAQLATGEDGERIDFFSRSITTPGFDGCRVAILGMKPEDKRSAETTAYVRQLTTRQFETRDDAMGWLCASAELPQSA